MDNHDVNNRESSDGHFGLHHLIMMYGSLVAKCSVFTKQMVTVSAVAGQVVYIGSI